MRIRSLIGPGARAVSVAVVMGVAGAANAAPPVEFVFEQLDSSYQASASLLTIMARDQPGFFSFGHVSRGVGSAGSAVYDQGFVSEPDPSDFRLELAISQQTPTTALASGPLTVTDVDGDVFHALVTGIFRNEQGRSTLIAQMSEMGFTSDEQTFDGPDGGVFSTSFPSGLLSAGTLRLSFETGPRSFDGDFAAAETGLVGWVPAPSGAVLLALAGMGAARRRR
jgi:hypothetical protein